MGFCPNAGQQKVVAALNQFNWDENLAASFLL
jgi:hypothetical protein